ncbi:MAG: ATP-grasp domain-containing protein [Bacillota bacterium]
MKLQIPVLIAGIGGASLGTEIFKCLRDTASYSIYGCDISQYAYGHYQEGFTETFRVNRYKYVESIREICTNNGIQAIVPGGEEPLTLLGPCARSFADIGVAIAANSPEVIATCSNKGSLFKRLKELNIPTPETFTVRDISEVKDISYPCVIKPVTETGGSSFVFLVSDRDEIKLYISYLLKNRGVALIQEYIPLDEGEFTIGVLSLPNGRLVGSIAMQRLFNTKLSVSAKTNTGLISSGYSQGLIDDFLAVRVQAERIAAAINSAGPLNIQGRVRNGTLLPFEINPRFSASTYLRSMAGLNEIDTYLRYILLGDEPVFPAVKFGYYLRSLQETFVGKEEVKQ